MKKKIAILLTAVTIFQCAFTSTAAANTGTDNSVPDPFYEVFETPPFESKSRPLWFWNSPSRSLSDITKGDIREIMVRSKEESGYYGFGILPNWLDNYMSEDYLDLYEYALETAKELGMKMCLYDEDGFPSGPAGGLLAKEYPEATLKRLDKVEKDVNEAQEVVVRLPEGEYRTYLGAVAMNNDTKEIIDITKDTVIYEENGPGVYSASHHPAIKDMAYTVDKAFDGDTSENSRWNAANGETENQWLEAHFPEYVTMDKVEIYESFNRINKYEFQYYDGSDWVDLTTGTTIGDMKTITFPATCASRFRLNVHNQGGKADQSPSIREIKFYNGGTEVVPPQMTEESYDHVKWNAPEGSWKIMTFASVKDDTNTRGLVDYLSEEAVDSFINVTHEAYYERFPQYFGTVIDSAFYDEPPLYHAQGRTWTGRFNELFEAEKGYNPITLYPALWYDIGDNTAAARSQLYSFRSELFAVGYIKNMNDWCNEHGIKLTGHVDQEENVNPVQSVGDLMKVFKYQDMPGVDEISQYDRALKAYKIVSSSANNWDKEKVMTETYGAMGEGMGVPVLYKDIMNQFTRGINYVVPHAIWHNNVQAVDNPPELSYRSEQYGPALPAYNDYIGRTQGLLQGGRHVADIGVVYPISTLEAGTMFEVGDPYLGVAPIEADYMEVGEFLMSGLRKDYTFLHPEVIDEKCEVVGKELKLNNDINKESYKVMVLPGAKTISAKALKKIKEYYDAGGQVIATTQLPYQSAEPGRNEEVVDIITEMFGMSRDDMNPILPVVNYSASSSFNGDYGPEKAFDKIASNASRWNAADLSGGDQWLQAEFEQNVTIEKVVLKENIPYRVTKFKVQYWDGSQWLTAQEGTEIGGNREVLFSNPVTTDKIRLYIDTIKSDSVSIQEFEVYGKEGFNLAVPSDYPIGLADHKNEQGGRAVFLGGNYKEKLERTINEMLLVSDVTVEGADRNLPGGSFTYIHKVKDERDIYYFVNSSDSPIQSTVTLRGELKKPMLWNPHTGEQTPAVFEKTAVDGQKVTKVELSLDSVGSVFILDTYGEVEVPLESIQLDKTDITLKADDTPVQLNVTFNPADTTDDQTVTWESSNEKAAACVNGKVTPVGPGTAQIKAKSSVPGIEAVCNVTVEPPTETEPPSTETPATEKPEVVKVTGISLNQKNISVYPKKKAVIKATVLPANAANKKVTWKSSNPSVASVNPGGMVTGIKPGKASITAITQDGQKKASAVVTIKQYVEKISFKTPAYTVTKKGQSVKLNSHMTITPKNAFNKEVTWKSSNKKIATVDKNGLVKFKGKSGKVTITAAAKDGSKEKAAITLIYGKRISNIKLNKSKVVIKRGDTYQMKAVITKPDKPAYKKVVWSSSNPKAAKVDKNGKIKGLKKGKTTITALAGDGSGKKAKVKVTVK